MRVQKHAHPRPQAGAHEKLLTAKCTIAEQITLHPLGGIRTKSDRVYIGHQLVTAPSRQ
jgi:hypothetical protein